MEDAFLSGTSSKGSIASLIGRQVAGILGDRYLAASATLALVLVLIAGLLLNIGSGQVDKRNFPSTKRECLSIAAFGLFAIGLTIWSQQWPNALPAKLHRFDILSAYSLIFVGEFGSLAMLILYGVLFFRRKLNHREEQILLGAGTCFACAFFFSLSWASAKIMLIPAAPFVLALGLSNLRSNRLEPLLKAGAVAVALAWIAVAAASKMREPYYWADWHQGDALRATISLDLPELREIQVTPETAVFLRRVLDDIEHYSRPADAIAEFPTMPIFYSLAHRAPTTFAFIHYIDVTPDVVYVRDAQNLERNPPAMILLLSRSEAELRESEINFRAGRPSGERTLWETLGALRCKYRVADVLRPPNADQDFEVWVKRPSNSDGSCSSTP